MMNDMDTILMPTAQNHGIGIINASGLHMGVLTERGAPRMASGTSSSQGGGEASSGFLS